MNNYDNLFLNDMITTNLNDIYENVYLHSGCDVKLNWNNCIASSNSKIIKKIKTI